MSKRILIWFTFALAGVGAFLGLKRMKKAEIVAINERHPILKPLGERDRNSVHLALWTLQSNKMLKFERIDFDAPYSNVQPSIERIRSIVGEMPEEKLNALDESLGQHRKFYSVI